MIVAALRFFRRPNIFCISLLVTVWLSASFAFGQDRQDFVVDGVKFREVPVAAKEMPHCVTWSTDAESFFCLDAVEHKLKKFETKGLKELGSLDLDAKATWLSLSRWGVVLTFADQSEIWLVDAEKLAVLKKASVPTASRVYSTPALSVGFATLRGQGRHGLGMIDMKSGKLLRIFQTEDFRLPPKMSLNWERLAIAADGKTLFAGSGGCIQRFKFSIGDKKLNFEQSTPEIAHEGKELVISYDGSLIAWPCGGGNNSGAPKHPAIPPYSTYVYATKDLSQPKCVLRQGAYPQAIGLDSIGERLFAQNHETTMLLFNKNGLSIGAVNLRGHGAYQFAPSPKGNDLLLLTSAKLFLVDPSGYTPPAGNNKN